MSEYNELASWLADTWHVWVVTLTLIVAAVIDGLQLKVPNWLTYPMIISGWLYSAFLSPYPGWEGVWFSLIGTAVGLAVLLPAYAIGGMGAGDVKLMAGVGAWMWGTATFYAFAATTIVGAVMAIAMVLWTKSWDKHKAQFWGIINEIATVKDPEKLATLAAERKPRMFLLPYGIPMAVGTIGYFAWNGMRL